METTQNRILETYMRRQDFKYYVYIRPGVIEYFRDYGRAKEFADAWGVEVKEME